MQLIKLYHHENKEEKNDEITATRQETTKDLSNAP